MILACPSPAPSLRSHGQLDTCRAALGKGQVESLVALPVFCNSDAKEVIYHRLGLDPEAAQLLEQTLQFHRRCSGVANASTSVRPADKSPSTFLAALLGPEVEAVALREAREKRCDHLFYHLKQLQFGSGTPGPSYLEPNLQQHTVFGHLDKKNYPFDCHLCQYFSARSWQVFKKAPKYREARSLFWNKLSLSSSEPLHCEHPQRRAIGNIRI